MKQIEDLTNGDKIYDVNVFNIKWYRYLCIHPNSSSYHILIDMNEEPIRIYNKDLQTILNKNLNSYDDAKLLLAETFERRAKSLRERD